MVRKQVKEAFKSAEKDLREEEGEQLKEVIKATLEKLKEKQAERMKLDKEIKLLKRDIDDFKEGRLDRIAERQEKDELAKEVSVFEIVKKEVKEVYHHHHYDRWYWPYTITWKDQYVPHVPMVFGSANTTAWNDSVLTTTDSVSCFAVNCSVAKDFTAGAYNMSSGDVVHL